MDNANTRHLICCIFSGDRSKVIQSYSTVAAVLSKRGGRPSVFTTVSPFRNKIDNTLFRLGAHPHYQGVRGEIPLHSYTRYFHA
jgi:adenylylsulfate kinase-like enzyme